MEYRIIIDSCGDLTPDMKADPHIVSVPLTLRVGATEIIDDESFDQKDFLARVAACEECPKSACPSPDSYLHACGDADRAYIVTLSSELSGSYNSALLAARMFEDEHPGSRCHVFNSRSASVGQTLIGLNIRELETMGATFDEVVAGTEAYIEQQHTYFVLDNLDTLRKNGRLSRIKAFMASALKIKPVMGSTPEGAIAQLDQTRGANKALKLMCTIAAKNVLEKVKRELYEEKIAYDENIQVGVMIETPAAVMISGELAREMDFFSLGTNDLTQYTLAMDRTNRRIAGYYNPKHPALIKMIRIVANNVHLEGKRISICGDLAADLSMTEQFINMGIDELSVAPSQILALRKHIRELK